MNPAIVWFRHDLRLADNPALHAAAASKRPLVCVYIFDGKSSDLRSPGGASRWWLHGSLQGLGAALKQRGGGLTILRGAPERTLLRLAAELNAAAVYWNRRYDEPGRTLDSSIKARLRQDNIEVSSFNSHLLHEPWTLRNQSGKPFRVFTAYWRAALKQGVSEAPLAAPRALKFLTLPSKIKLRAVELADLELQPTRPDWAGGLRSTWTADEPGARAQVKRFLSGALQDYSTDRDRPDRVGTSRLSPYLAFGNISVRQVWHIAREAVRSRRSPVPAGDSLAGRSVTLPRQLEKLFAELGWREFNYHLLYHFPDITRCNFQSKFDPLQWRQDAKGLRAWQRGLTGYPIVDAGMRELWTTGWMHNRVRMVAASFLVKHLLIDWRSGEEWFWNTLVDADPANNPANWQWVAGTGADAAPYFRIFNPVLQGEKFDPDGVYVRKWIPEIARLPDQVIHKPWAAKPAQLAAAGVELGKTYPHPIVDHDKARQRALMNLTSIRRAILPST
jgi:deoxyribodipyrimidine photo-lyase